MIWFLPLSLLALMAVLLVIGTRKAHRDDTWPWEQ